MREILFSVGIDTIHPSTVQDGGEAAKVKFILPPELVNYVARFDFGDGGGELHTSDRFPITTNEISFVIPRDWIVSGISTIRLVVSHTEEGTEVFRWQSLAGKIAFRKDR